jgi:hypothetical protein
MIDDLLHPTGPPASPEVRERIYRRTLPLLRRRRPIAAALLVIGAMAAALMLMVQRPQPARAALPRDAVSLEWKALKDPSLYRAAADRYLEEGWPEEALRCYGHALDTADDLELQPEDSYLLMVIKEARRKEKSNEDDADLARRALPDWGDLGPDRRAGQGKAGG